MLNAQVRQAITRRTLDTCVFQICLLLAAALASVLPDPVLAQNQKASVDLLPAASQSLVVLYEPTMQFNEITIPNGRRDVDAGVLRAAYGIQAAGPVQATPELTARAWMAQVGGEFGWSTGEDLVLVDEVETAFSAHLTFQQTFHGIPVHRRFIKVNLGADGLPTMVLSAYAPHLAGAGAFDVAPLINADQARTIATQLVTLGDASSTEPVLVVYPLEVPVLAWTVTAWPEGAPGEWEVLINARSGAAIYLLDLAMYHHGDEEDPDNVRRTDGKGMVWIPDPITSAGVSYGGDYVDNGDANSDVLNNERVEVVLHDISQGPGGGWVLVGPSVTISGDPGYSYNPPEESDPADFKYLRNNPHFESVMVYYHIDASQRYVQSLALGRDIDASGLRANPHGLGSQDNSAYYPSQNALVFGDGGIDDAEDAEVIIHEYAHALLDDSAPGLVGASVEARALHEGWADYWAVSYTRAMMQSGEVPQRNWRKVFDWDGNETWNGRTLNWRGKYPDDYQCDAPAQHCNIYQDGVIWATTMMEVYDLVGREVSDRLNLLSHGYLSTSVRFPDAAQALVQADRDHYQGAHLGQLGALLADRGLIDCVPGFASELRHEPLDRINDAPYSLALELETEVCTGGTLPHHIHWALDNDSYTRTPMIRLSDQVHRHYIQIPEGVEKVRYYFEVEQPTGERLWLPGNAPQSVFTIPVGNDAEAPVITHAYLTHVAEEDWPPTVTATVTDESGVQATWIEYQIESPDGTRSSPASFFLTPQLNGVYEGIFPSFDLPIKSRVHYRMRARDRAGNPNVQSVPPESEPPYVIHIIQRGILATYDADEGDVLSAGGVWRRAKPAQGLQDSYSGERAWVTTDDGPYTAQTGVSVLEIPEIDLIHFDDAYLELQHWHDFEHQDVTQPVGSPAGSAFDGGNVKFSTDDGVSWQVLVPEWGYTRALHNSNPRAGEQAYAGYSYGWRRALFAMPNGPSVKLRIEAAFNSGNANSSAHDYAGWAIDDIRILAERPTDDAAPRLFGAPEELIVVAPSDPLPAVWAVTTDQTGIESVIADYIVRRRDGSWSRHLERLAMDIANRVRYAAHLQIEPALQLGEEVRYSLRISDFDGNTLRVPEDESEQHLMVVRQREQIWMLARSNANGYWAPHSSGGYATTGGGDHMVSSIMLDPIDVPTNAASVTFRLYHTGQLNTSAGNVKVSADNGGSWQVVHPTDGYDGAFVPVHPNPMSGEGVFSGSLDETSRFDLSAFVGRPLWVRIDLGTVNGLDGDESWVVRRATIEHSTNEDAFVREPEIALHANYPDPFTGQTTLSYSLTEPVAVRLEVYNLLGQRVRMLVDGPRPAGLHTLHLDLSEMATGIYYLQMTTGPHVFTESLILAH